MSTNIRSPPRRVSALRALSLVLAFAAVLGLVFGTAGFTSMSADRGLDVNVTDDESAYLGYAPLTDEIHDGEPTSVVEYRNQFGNDLDEFHVTVSIVNSDGTRATIKAVDSPDSLDRGASESVDVTLHCPVEEEVDLLFEANGSGAGVSVSLDRVQTLTCVPDGTAAVRYAGVGNAFVTPIGANDTVEAVIWLTTTKPRDEDSSGEIDPVTVRDLNTSKPVLGQLPSNVQNQSIAAIEFRDRGIAFFHPGWNAGKHRNPSSGRGVPYTEVPLNESIVSNAAVDGRTVVVDRDSK